MPGPERRDPGGTSCPNRLWRTAAAAARQEPVAAVPGLDRTRDDPASHTVTRWRAGMLDMQRNSPCVRRTDARDASQADLMIHRPGRSGGESHPSHPSLVAAVVIPRHARWKRALDVISSLVLLVVLSPLFLFCAVAIAV